MNTYKSFISKASGVVLPLLPIVTILAPIIYACYFCADWALQQRNNDIQINSRVSNLELSSNETHDAIIQIQSTQHQMNEKISEMKLRQEQIFTKLDRMREENGFD